MQHNNEPINASIVKDVLKIVGIVVLFAIIAIILKANKDSLLNPEYIRSLVQRDYTLGVLGFLFFGSLIAGFGMPRLAISGVAGMLFGAIAGSVYGLIASLGGATVNFFWARWFMRGPLTRRLPKRMRPWYDRFNQHGFRYMLYLRLFPLSNSTATNTLGGISHMPYRTFILSTFLGWIPLGIVSSLFGSSAAKQDYRQLAIGGICLVAVIVIERYIHKRAEKDLKEVENEASNAEDDISDIKA